MDTLMVVFIGAILFFQSSLLFWIALVTGILSSLVAWVYSGYFSKQQRQLMSDRSSIHSFLIEVLTGYGTIKAMNAVEYVYDEFEKRQMESVWTNHKFSIGQNIQSSLVSFIDGAGGNVLYWMGCLLILKDQFTLGQLISFNVLLVYFLGPLKRLLKLQPNLQGAMVAAERLNQILSIEPEIPENGSWLKPTRFFGKLEFRNVFFQYAANSPVLRNVSLSIEAGQRVAIVGSSGCGKTTILRLLMKFYRPLSGSIMIDGHNIQDVDTMHLRSRIGYVPQEIFLISGSITDNIALHRSDASIEEIVEASRKAGAHEFIERLPNRYNTIIGERGTMFSGGERQRLALARALLGDPDILVLDEATSNLDSISERRMHLTLENLRSEKKTTILVAHRLSTVVGCDKIFVIDKGNIIEYGNHTELIAGNGYYAKLWEMNTV
jgi:ATP-binding cassette subfamily B protein